MISIAAEKHWIASRCRTYFSGAVVHEAPDLRFLREDIALLGLAEKRFQTRVGPQGKAEFKKIVDAVRHVAKTWAAHAALHGNSD